MAQRGHDLLCHRRYIEAERRSKRRHPPYIALLMLTRKGGFVGIMAVAENERNFAMGCPNRREQFNPDEDCIVHTI